MKEKKLHRVTKSDRRNISLSASRNRRWRHWEEAARDAKIGPHCCSHCHAEPCGAAWPRGACCHKCTHEPMARWRLTHVIWYHKKPFYVMEVAARRPGVPTEEERRELEQSASLELEEEQRRGQRRSEKLPASEGSVTDAVYYRWDGVSFWVRRARTHYFLGVRVSTAEFMRTLPSEEELLEFAPREAPPNPFEESIAERPEDETGDAINDRTDLSPERQPLDEGGHYVESASEDRTTIFKWKDTAQRPGWIAEKKGLTFVEVEDDGVEGEGDG